jgi:ring-1,2-phenylacetyl-CoA epoxidase subunit PaaC
MTTETLPAELHTPLKNLLYAIADDNLVMGHRHSEWTGLGPVLEEDIAFSSIAQDQVGLSFQLYTLLNEKLGEDIPDRIAFTRDEKAFRSAQLVEHPIGEYDFSLVRQFLFDHAEAVRFANLAECGWEPIHGLAKKVLGEIKYHTFHADTWLKKLAAGTEESRARMQSALNYTYPMALGLFEAPEGEQALVNAQVWVGMDAAHAEWESRIRGLLSQWGYTLPNVSDGKAHFGGRFGYHTEHLQPMLDEMGVVFRTDVQAEW